MSHFPITDKTEITRLAKRGSYDKETIYSILDEALFCTLAYAVDGQAFQIPPVRASGDAVRIFAAAPQIVTSAERLQIDRSIAQRTNPWEFEMLARRRHMPMCKQGFHPGLNK